MDKLIDKSRSKRRTSILKKQVISEDNSPTETPTFKNKNRISFSCKNSVKEFCAGEDAETIWGPSYEESASSTSPKTLEPSIYNICNEQSLNSLPARQILHHDKKHWHMMQKQFVADQALAVEFMDKENAIYYNNDKENVFYDTLKTYSGDKEISVSKIPIPKIMFNHYKSPTFEPEIKLLTRIERVSSSPLSTFNDYQINCTLNHSEKNILDGRRSSEDGSSLTLNASEYGVVKYLRRKSPKKILINCADFEEKINVSNFDIDMSMGKMDTTEGFVEIERMIIEKSQIASKSVDDNKILRNNNSQSTKICYINDDKENETVIQKKNVDKRCTIYNEENLEVDVSKIFPQDCYQNVELVISPEKLSKNTNKLNQNFERRTMLLNEQLQLCSDNIKNKIVNKRKTIVFESDDITNISLEEKSNANFKIENKDVEKNKETIKIDFPILINEDNPSLKNRQTIFFNTDIQNINQINEDMEVDEIKELNEAKEYETTLKTELILENSVQPYDDMEETLIEIETEKNSSKKSLSFRHDPKANESQYCGTTNFKDLDDTQAMLNELDHPSRFFEEKIYCPIKTETDNEFILTSQKKGRRSICEAVDISIDDQELQEETYPTIKETKFEYKSIVSPEINSVKIHKLMKNGLIEDDNKDEKVFLNMERMQNIIQTGNCASPLLSVVKEKLETNRRTILEKLDISVENDVIISSDIENDKRRTICCNFDLSSESKFVLNENANQQFSVTSKNKRKSIIQSIDMEIETEDKDECLDNNKSIKENYNDNVYQILCTNNIDETTDNNNSSTQNMFKSNSKYFGNRDEMDIEQNSLKEDLDDIRKNTSLDLKEKISEYGDKIQKNEIYSNLNNPEKLTNMQFKSFGENLLSQEKHISNSQEITNQNNQSKGRCNINDTTEEISFIRKPKNMFARFSNKEHAFDQNSINLIQTKLEYIEDNNIVESRNDVKNFKKSNTIDKLKSVHKNTPPDPPSLKRINIIDSTNNKEINLVNSSENVNVNSRKTIIFSSENNKVDEDEKDGNETLTGDNNFSKEHFQAIKYQSKTTHNKINDLELTGIKELEDSFDTTVNVQQVAHEIPHLKHNDSKFEKNSNEKIDMDISFVQSTNKVSDKSINLKNIVDKIEEIDIFKTSENHNDLHQNIDEEILQISKALNCFDLTNLHIIKDNEEIFENITNDFKTIDTIALSGHNRKTTNFQQENYENDMEISIKNRNLIEEMDQTTPNKSDEEIIKINISSTSPLKVTSYTLKGKSPRKEIIVKSNECILKNQKSEITFKNSPKKMSSGKFKKTPINSHSRNLNDSGSYCRTLNFDDAPTQSKNNTEITDSPIIFFNVNENGSKSFFNQNASYEEEIDKTKLSLVDTFENSEDNSVSYFPNENNNERVKNHFEFKMPVISDSAAKINGKRRTLTQNKTCSRCKDCRLSMDLTRIDNFKLEAEPVKQVDYSVLNKFKGLPTIRDAWIAHERRQAERYILNSVNIKLQNCSSSKNSNNLYDYLDSSIIENQESYMKTIQVENCIPFGNKLEAQMKTKFSEINNNWKLKVCSLYNVNFIILTNIRCPTFELIIECCPLNFLNYDMDVTRVFIRQSAIYSEESWSPSEKLIHMETIKKLPSEKYLFVQCSKLNYLNDCLKSLNEIVVQAIENFQDLKTIIINEKAELEHFEDKVAIHKIHRYTTEKEVLTKKICIKIISINEVSIRNVISPPMAEFTTSAIKAFPIGIKFVEVILQDPISFLA